MRAFESRNSFPLRLENRSYRFVNLRNMETVEGPVNDGDVVEIDGWAFVEALDSHETWVIAFDTRGSVTSNDTEEKHMRLLIRREEGFLEIDSGIALGTGNPHVFVHRGKGDLDEAINGFRDFLQKNVLPPLTGIDPQLSYNVWYTDDAAERLYLEDAEFAAWMGFDVFTIDASWNEGGSIIPATNDWGAGLGSYVESRVKFPHGIRYLSDRVHDLGLKFGLWVDPQNVDTRRVTSGEIPESWVARIDGKDLQCDHPTLSLMTELCLGNPEVVEWLRKELSRVIDEWRVDWVKWDPSGTVSYACDRTDHGHSSEDGAKAYFRGRRGIMTYLFERHPHLNGWECIFDMEICRVNPLEGHYRNVLPAYMNRFVTGPMVGPHVWGSMEYIFGTHESHDSLLASPYYEASYLDYFFRRILCAGGLSMGNITGLVSQRLRNAPLGYNDAFKRNMLQFKQYRHLYLEDCFRTGLMGPVDNWNALQYVKRDASESLLFVFRNGGSQGNGIVRLRGLDAEAEYTVGSWNQRPGKERTFSGRDLAQAGISVTLPDPYLAKANYSLDRMDEATRKAFESQLVYGSDVLVLTRKEGK